MNAEIAATAAPVSLTNLNSGAIGEPPNDLLSLVFATGDRAELATARCSTAELSKRRISCAVAVHQLAQIGGTEKKCIGSLTLRQLEFSKTEEGDWINEDSIAICGGRLLRRTELFPVALNGDPRYALRETYQMLGGDASCAAPYLSSREPLRKAYVPATAEADNLLTCGTVANR